MKKITKSLADRLKTTGDTMTGELSLGGNKKKVLRDQTLAEDAANKQYVDASDTATNNTLSTLRTDFDKHIDMFKKFCKDNFQPIYKISNDFFGEPRIVDMKLADIKQTLDDVVAGIPEFDNKISLLKIPSVITPMKIKNIVYT